MELRIKINQKEHIAYIPKVLQNILGENPRATPNRAAVLLFSGETSLSDAIKSLDIIKADLLHAKEMQEKERAP